LRRLIEFPLEDGGSVVVEAEGPAGEVVRGLHPSDVPIQTKETFEAALARVQPAAIAIVNRLRGLADAPDEIEVEFGVQLSAELGAFVAKASADANFRISLRWQRGSQAST
jgi:Trypsin-co-occurring domain 1